MNATNFALDVYTDLATYHFPTVPPTRPQFRKLVRAVVHQPTVDPSTSLSLPLSPPSPPSPTSLPLSVEPSLISPSRLPPAVPRAHLNYIRHLASRYHERDPYRNLLLLQGYLALGPDEGAAWKLHLESLSIKTQHLWTRVEDFRPPPIKGRGDVPMDSMALHFTPEESQDIIRGVDSLRPVYAERKSFLDAWEGGPDRSGGGLDLGRAGIKFHRNRIYDLLWEHIPKVAATKTSTSPSTSVVSSTKVNLNAASLDASFSPSSSTLLRLAHLYPSLPLSSQLITIYLKLPTQYHFNDPLLLLFELHLRSLLLPFTGKKEFEEALTRTEKAAKLQGYGSWEAKMRKEGGVGWFDKEDRERMRQSLGMLKGVLGTKRRWWDCLDPVWLE